jgi:hypothetical protein
MRSLGRASTKCPKDRPGRTAGQELRLLRCSGPCLTRTGRVRSRRKGTGTTLQHSMESGGRLVPALSTLTPRLVGLDEPASPVDNQHASPIDLRAHAGSRPKSLSTSPISPARESFHAAQMQQTACNGLITCWPKENENDLSNSRAPWKSLAHDHYYTPEDKAPCRPWNDRRDGSLMFWSGYCRSISPLSLDLDDRLDQQNKPGKLQDCLRLIAHLETDEKTAT